MDLANFLNIVDQKKQENPFWFDDKPDSHADDNLITDVECRLGVKLPEKYKEFIKNFGGGYFAFTNIFSVDRSGEWYIVKKNDEARSYLPKNFIAISDDEMGGMYGYVVHGGVCAEEIFYWNHDDSNPLSKEMYEDLFEYIVEIGLTN